MEMSERHVIKEKKNLVLISIWIQFLLLLPRRKKKYATEKHTYN